MPYQICYGLSWCLALCHRAVSRGGTRSCSTAASSVESPSDASDPTACSATTSRPTPGARSSVRGCPQRASGQNAIRVRSYPGRARKMYPPRPLPPSQKPPRFTTSRLEPGRKVNVLCSWKRDPPEWMCVFGAVTKCVFSLSCKCAFYLHPHIIRLSSVQHMLSSLDLGLLPFALFVRPGFPPLAVVDAVAGRVLSSCSLRSANEECERERSATLNIFRM